MTIQQEIILLTDMEEAFEPFFELFPECQYYDKECAPMGIEKSIKKEVSYVQFLDKKQTNFLKHLIEPKIINGKMAFDNNDVRKYGLETSPKFFV